MLKTNFYHIPANPFRYLHVVRDGRDIALSENTSPVRKFYNIIYLNKSGHDPLSLVKINSSTMLKDKVSKYLLFTG